MARKYWLAVAGLSLVAMFAASGATCDSGLSTMANLNGMTTTSGFGAVMPFSTTASPFIPTPVTTMGTTAGMHTGTTGVTNTGTGAVMTGSGMMGTSATAMPVAPVGMSNGMGGTMTGMNF